ncbi:U3 small nucleolar ribonucleoprotein complex, subunit Mpp10 [Flagelloscypha sp. PMI_526]|nr:U3 small nucleolar ribonucleoprotein complex, subunit Mpp10 [Flagelloscypha sp. PMI_526]
MEECFLFGIVRCVFYRLSYKHSPSFVEEKPECFAFANPTLGTAALDATKFLFDLGGYIEAVGSESISNPHIQNLLDSLVPSEAPQTRSQAARTSTKRKRTPSPPPTLTTTPLGSLFVDGMDYDQVWSQLDLRTKNVCRVLEQILLEGEEEGDTEPPSLEDDDDSEEDVSADHMGDDDADEDEWIDEDDSDEGEDAMAAMDIQDESSEDEADLGETIAELRDVSSEEDERDLEGSRRKSKRRPQNRTSRARRHILRPRKFQCRDRRSLKLVKTASPRTLMKESVDLFAPVDDAEAFEPEEDLEEPPELFYKDFFDPPPKPAKKHNPANASTKTSGVRFHDEVRVKAIKPRGNGNPVSSMQTLRPLSSIMDDEETEDTGFDKTDDEYDGEEEEPSVSASDEDGDETMERLKDDLFADDDVEDEDEAGLSTHEKRLRALQEEISQLETENTSKKDWVLMGEATSRARPHNSLLEEDLDFERVMKSVPLVTEEAVKSLEDTIKARILEGRFDDVVRIRPLDDKPFLPSRLIELSDKKSADSLAQIYENEYVAQRDGKIDGAEKDAKLAKEHKEIEDQWERISNKLDALCNAHFTPKQPKAIIETLSNIPTASMESALPTSQSASTILAPEEVFAPSNEVRARSELTPSEKKALHRGVKKQKKEALKSMVKKGKGVTVVGKQKQVKELKKGKRK